MEMRLATVCVLTSVLALAAPPIHQVRAETASDQDLDLVCQNWLSYVVFQKGDWAGEVEPKIIAVDDIMAGDMVVARRFAIAPRGYVVVPVLKELPPIKAYSERSDLNVSETDGVSQLLREVLADRIRLYVWKYGSLEASQPPAGDVLLGRANRQAWDRFLVAPDEFNAALESGGFVTLTEVGPLLTSDWHQSAPYNNDCPDGDGDRTVVGCVATAAAQLLHYHEWPPNGVGSHTYYWPGDDSCGGSTLGEALTADFSDAYDWANIPDNCDPDCTPAEQDALAELCFEVGVAYEMDYGACGSGAYTYMAQTILPRYFRYAPGIENVNRSDHTAESWFGIVQAEIDAGRPMLYTIHRHAIVCDGWADTGGQDQYHMNYGWGGSQTLWYTIDDLYCPWAGCDPMVERLLRYIQPFQPADPDCNDNGVEDYLDIWEGTSGDCNSNAVPDECDTALGTSEDCQPDSVPDECQVTELVVPPPGNGSCSETATDGNAWCDDFESYSLGSIQGLNGWQGWGPDGGEPTAAGNVSDEQNHTPGGSQSLKIEAHDTVHVFEGYTLETSPFWILSAWVYIPSDMTGTAMFIVNPDYVGGEAGTTWAVQIDMETTGGLIHSPESLSSLPLVMDDWSEIRLELNCVQDLVTIYYEDQLLGSHKWTMGGGSLGIAAVDLFSPDSSGFYYDDLSLYPSVSIDCNNSGFPDECDIAAGTSEDCQPNGIPDECDIAFGTSSDVNQSGIPDECDSGLPIPTVSAWGMMVLVLVTLTVGTILFRRISKREPATR
jgi:hypothetical protein